MYTISKVLLEKIAEATKGWNWQIDLDDFIEYSGRSMYGRKCLGLLLDSDMVSTHTVVLAAGFILGRDYEGADQSLGIEDEEVLFEMCNAREDNMGQLPVLYWPNIQVEAGALGSASSLRWPI